MRLGGEGRRCMRASFRDLGRSQEAVYWAVTVSLGRTLWQKKKVELAMRKRGSQAEAVWMFGLT
jgi:hypothetical protein